MGPHQFPRNILWESQIFSDDRVLLHIPPSFNPKRPAVMVVFFHGHGANLAKDVRDRQQAPAQITAAGVNAVLNLPLMPPIRALASSGSQTVSSASSMNKPPPSVDYERVAPNEAAGSFRGVRTVRSSSWQGSVGGGSEAPSGRGRKSKLEAEHPGGHVPIKAKFAEFFGKSITRHSERVWRPSLLRRIAHRRCPRSQPQAHVDPNPIRGLFPVLSRESCPPRWY